ncbi:hypothetical protein FLP10_14650 [Agromyces intestinalis]|uniref:Uncharacterized protein n=1 Tax=Agromyces intestinalis TaxID=2592652 RepID=A0A5C1YHU7_9MICO|nr:hypothetical protein [Agromyces intestinalis]QEO15533.1 hypothetical protein FLP10_14650 [Agromyces intestinalis]
MSGELISIVAGLAFAGLFVGTTLLASDGLALDRRARHLERRDPGTAAALRRAQAVSDFSRGGVFGDEAFGSVCSPSRRAWFDVARTRGSDLDPRYEASEEALPPMPATVVALASGDHLANQRRMPQPPRSAPDRPAVPAPAQPAGANSPGHHDAASG